MSLLNLKTRGKAVSKKTKKWPTKLIWTKKLQKNRRIYSNKLRALTKLLTKGMTSEIILLLKMKKTNKFNRQLMIQLLIFMLESNNKKDKFQTWNCIQLKRVILVPMLIGSMAFCTEVVIKTRMITHWNLIPVYPSSSIQTTSNPNYHHQSPYNSPSNLFEPYLFYFARSFEKTIPYYLKERRL